MAADPRSPYAGPLVERLAADAQRRGAVDEAVHHRPSTTTYAALERAATVAGSWEVERERADPVLATADPQGWVSTLLRQGDSAAAWGAAESMAERMGLELWRRLFRARVRIDPASTLPHYRRLVEQCVLAGDRGSYQTAARLLRNMRDAATRADRSAEFETDDAELRERYRRRPAVHDELRRGGA